MPTRPPTSPFSDTAVLSCAPGLRAPVTVIAPPIAMEPLTPPLSTTPPPPSPVTDTGAFTIRSPCNGASRRTP